jgi:hypothetical protein
MQLHPSVGDDESTHWHASAWLQKPMDAPAHAQVGAWPAQAAGTAMQRY